MQISPLESLPPLVQKPGIIHTSLEEYELTLNELETGKISPLPGEDEYDPQIYRAAIFQVRKIIEAMKRGELVYEPGLSTGQAENQKSGQDTSTIYPAKKEIPKPPDCSNKGTVSISEMDFEALMKEIPYGKITPPMPGVLFKCAPLRTPCQTGFITDLGYESMYPVSLYIDLPLSGKTPGFEIIYPPETKIIPVPLGAELISINPQVKTAVPTEVDPVIWRLQKRLSGLSYTIRQAEKNTELLKVKKELFLPSEEEQKYWQTVLPLPQALKERIKESPDDLIHLIASYLGVKDQETGLTNFRYVCNPAFGRFVFNNAEDLPLIMSELKAGHCDLLSWYVAAQLRAYGNPAWAATDLVTIKDGSAFNSAYKHSTVVFVKKDGSLAYFDPTIHSDFDRAYHPKILENQKVDELEERLQKAKTIKQKIKALRDFNKSIKELRIKAESNNEVRKDIEKLTHNSLRNLFTSESEFDDSNVRIREQVADWNKLPTVINDETIEAVISRMPKDFLQSSDIASYSITTILDVADTRTSREKLKWIYNAFNAKKLFPGAISPDKRVFNETRLEKDEIIDLWENINFSYYGLWHYNSLPFTDFEDLLSVTKENVFRQREALHLDDLIKHNLTSLVKKNSHYNYSKYFLNALQKGNLIHTLEQYYPVSYYSKIDDFTKDCQIETPQSHRKELIKDMLYFVLECQLAFINPKYKEDLLNRLGIDKRTFRSIAKYFLDMKEEDCRAKALHTVQTSQEIKNYVSFVNSMLYLDNSSGSYREKINSLLKKLDLKKSRANTVETGDLRPYTFGDDLRKVSWPATAKRGDGQYMMKLDPFVTGNVSTPLYVFVCADDEESGKPPINIITTLQTIELIRILQSDSKNKKREVYLGSNFSPAYLKLQQNVKPEDIYAMLFSSGKNYKGPFITSGSLRPVLPPNLLFATTFHGQALAMKYLYGSACNLETLCFNELPVYPLIKDSWVENGFSEEILQTYRDFRKKRDADIMHELKILD